MNAVAEYRKFAHDVASVQRSSKAQTKASASIDGGRMNKVAGERAATLAAGELDVEGAAGP